MSKGYRLMDHTADFGLEIFGDDPASVFKNAAGALSDLITDPAVLKGNRQRRLEIQGDDWADLMVNWLRELLYCWNGDRQLIANATIHSIEPTRLSATVTLDDFQPQRHEIRNEIKAVTYHQIEVAPSGDGWKAKVIVDI